MPVVRTRTMNIFGPMQDTEKYIPMLIKKISNGETVTIHGSKDRVGSRMYLHVYNLADAWLYLAEHITPKAYIDDDSREQVYDAFNITGQEEISNFDLAVKISNIIGKPLKYDFKDFHAARPGHDRRYAISGDKMKSVGWSHPYDIDRSLKQVVEWTLENKEWML